MVHARSLKFPLSNSFLLLGLFSVLASCASGATEGADIDESHDTLAIGPSNAHDRWAPEVTDAEIVRGELNFTPLKEDATVSERTGEAQEPDTAAECVARYQAQKLLCDQMPAFEMAGCLLAAHILLAYCLKTG